MDKSAETVNPFAFERGCCVNKIVKPQQRANQNQIEFLSVAAKHYRTAEQSAQFASGFFNYFMT